MKLDGNEQVRGLGDGAQARIRLRLIGGYQFTGGDGRLAGVAVDFPAHLGKAVAAQELHFTAQVFAVVEDGVGELAGEPGGGGDKDGDAGGEGFDENAARSRVVVGGVVEEEVDAAREQERFILLAGHGLFEEFDRGGGTAGELIELLAGNDGFGFALGDVEVGLKAEGCASGGDVVLPKIFNEVGDEVIALFTAGIAHVDDAQRAGGSLFGTRCMGVRDGDGAEGENAEAVVLGREFVRIGVEAHIMAFEFGGSGEHGVAQALDAPFLGWPGGFPARVDIAAEEQMPAWAGFAGAEIVTEAHEFNAREGGDKDDVARGGLDIAQQARGVFAKGGQAAVLLPPGEEIEAAGEDLGGEVPGVGGIGEEAAEVALGKASGAEQARGGTAEKDEEHYGQQKQQEEKADEFEEDGGWDESGKRGEVGAVEGLLEEEVAEAVADGP